MCCFGRARCTLGRMPCGTLDMSGQVYTRSTKRVTYLSQKAAMTITVLNAGLSLTRLCTRVDELRVRLAHPMKISFAVMIRPLRQWNTSRASRYEAFLTLQLKVKSDLEPPGDLTLLARTIRASSAIWRGRIEHLSRRLTSRAMPIPIGSGAAILSPTGWPRIVLLSGRPAVPVTISASKPTRSCSSRLKS